MFSAYSRCVGRVQVPRNFSTETAAGEAQRRNSGAERGAAYTLQRRAK